MKQKTMFFDKFIYKIQAFGLKFLIILFKILGLKISTFLFSILFVLFGPIIFFKSQIIAIKNIKKALKKSTFKSILITIYMWNHFGRDLGEFLFFFNKKQLIKHISLDKKSISILKKISKNPQGEIIFTAHFGNWELLPTLFDLYDIKTSTLYRKMNNIYADKIVLDLRHKANDELITKGRNGVIKIVRAIKSGRKLFMLVDQRLSKGVEVPFFNMNAKTSDSTATFAIKNNIKVYSIVSIRKHFFSSQFKIKIEEFEIKKTTNQKLDIIENTIRINKKIESWIKKHPEQYFWFHNRWKQ